MEKRKQGLMAVKKKKGMKRILVYDTWRQSSRIVSLRERKSEQEGQLGPLPCSLEENLA